MNFIFKTRGPLDPVADHAILIERPELKQLVRAMEAPTVDAYYAILSARQTGKTTLLYQLRARVRADGYGAALLDLAGVRDQPEADFYRFVASQILSELDPLPPRRLKNAAEKNLPTNPIEFRRLLSHLAEDANVPRLIILIDEVEGVPEAFADGFFGTIRNIFSSRRKDDEAEFEKYCFVLAGAKELYRLTTGPNSPLNIAERIYLQDFSLAGIQKLAANLARAGIGAPTESATWIFEQTRGHPYLTHRLCAEIEQMKPAVVTRETVARAATEILRGDDHLAKMLLQIDAEPASKQTLQQILQGGQVRFSRLQPAVARLELIGAIRDNGNCSIRNPLYATALRARLNQPLVQVGIIGRLRRNLIGVVALVAAILLIVNLPVLYLYITDILLAPQQIDQRFEFKDPEIAGVIHFQPVLKSNAPATIIVEAEKVGGNTPVFVNFKKQNEDVIISDTSLRRQFNPPSHVERFNFGLSASPLPYNPFEPFTARRKVDLVFEPTRGAAAQTFSMEFRVDFYSAFLVSVGLSLVSALAAFGSLMRSWRHIQDFLVGKKRREDDE